MEKEGPTDVLAFPMDELRPGLVNEEPEEGVLGDLVLCPSVAEKQAQSRPHDRRDELDLLTVHGILHLLGYDHAEPDEHQEMFGLQAQLLAEWQRPREVRHDRTLSPDERTTSGCWSSRPSLVVVAGLFTTADAALRRSRRPAPRSSPTSAARAARLLVIVADPPRYLNTALFLRMLARSPRSSWSRS